MRINIAQCAKTRLNGGMISGRTTIERGIQAVVPSSEVGEATFEDCLLAVGKTQSRQDFIALFNHFAPRIKSYMVKGGMEAGDADELAQETMIAVWRKAALYDPAKAAASTWIFTVARNLRIDALRRRKGIGAAINMDDLPALATQNEPPDDALGRMEESKALSTALTALPLEQADLIQKAFFEEKTHSDIAQETGLPLGTVKSRIRLALERLRHGVKDLERIE